MELIYLDRYSIYLKNGQCVSVHAQTFDVVLNPDRSVLRIDYTSYDGLATSLLWLDASEVVCAIRERGQGTLMTERRLLGKIEYLEESAKSVLSVDKG